MPRTPTRGAEGPDSRSSLPELRTKLRKLRNRYEADNLTKVDSRMLPWKADPVLAGLASAPATHAWFGWPVTVSYILAQGSVAATGVFVVNRIRDWIEHRRHHEGYQSDPALVDLPLSLLVQFERLESAELIEFGRTTVERLTADPRMRSLVEKARRTMVERADREPKKKGTNRDHWKALLAELGERIPTGRRCSSRWPPTARPTGPVSCAGRAATCSPRSTISTSPAAKTTPTAPAATWSGRRCRRRPPTRANARSPPIRWS